MNGFVVLGFFLTIGTLLVVVTSEPSTNSTSPAPSTQVSTTTQPQREEKTILWLANLLGLFLPATLFLPYHQNNHQTNIQVEIRPQHPHITMTPSPEDTAVECNISNDLILLIDRSGSVGPDNYEIAKNFAAILASQWRKNRKNRVGVYLFHSAPSVWISLKKSEVLTAKQIESKILMANYSNATTAIRTPVHLALDSAAAEFQANPRYGIPRNFLVLTDGQSSNWTVLEASAQKLFALGRVRGYAVAVGTNVNIDDLRIMTGNEPDHIFQIPQFDMLTELLYPVSNEICKK